MADNWAELSTSKFFSTKDVADGPLTFTVKEIVKEEVAFQGKPPEMVTLIKFADTDRQMIAKAEVRLQLQELFPRPSDAQGKVIELFKDKTNFGGKKVDCLRVRAPAQPNF